MFKPLVIFSHKLLLSDDDDLIRKLAGAVSEAANFKLLFTNLDFHPI